MCRSGFLVVPHKSGGKESVAICASIAMYPSYTRMMHILPYTPRCKDFAVASGTEFGYTFVTLFDALYIFYSNSIASLKPALPCYQRLTKRQKHKAKSSIAF